MKDFQTVIVGDAKITVTYDYSRDFMTINMIYKKWNCRALIPRMSYNKDYKWKVVRNMKESLRTKFKELTNEAFDNWMMEELSED